jgi:outer membrane protein TolC
MSKRATLRHLVLSGLLLLAVRFAAAQSSFSTPAFPLPSYFRNAFTRQPQINLELPGSLRDMVKEGKLRLSVADVARLVVARNTQVWLARMDVQSSEPALLRARAPFDPVFSGSFNSTRSSSPTSSTLQASTQLNQNTQFSYQQQFSTGSTYTVGFSGAKNASNNSFVFLNPSIGTALNFNFTQSLLRNRGFFVQRAPFVIARINLQVSRERFEQILAEQLQAAENQYWDTVQSRESLAVLRNSLQLAEKSYDRDKRALELGALPPLDIYRSQTEVANRKVQVTSAEFDLKQQEDALRRLIAADLDGQVRNLPLELVDAPRTSLAADTLDTETAVETAVRRRPELDILRRQKVIDDTSVRVALNGLKPDIRLGGVYTSSGLGGNTALLSGGLSDALSQSLQFNHPTYGFSLSMNLPVRNRQAEADLAAAEIVQRRRLYQMRDSEQQVTLEVRNAVNRLAQSKANIAGSTAARDLALKTLEAEQRKYELGASTIFFVLEAQQRASDSETQLLNATIAYQKAAVALYRTTGTLLDERQVVVDQAYTGK